MYKHTCIHFIYFFILFFPIKDFGLKKCLAQIDLFGNRKKKKKSFITFPSSRLHSVWEAGVKLCEDEHFGGNDTILQHTQAKIGRKKGYFNICG